MLTGFNTDIDSEGVTYHVQTEDRGEGNPLIESLVYVKGEILASRRTEYRNLLEAGAERSLIRVLMERQHRAIVEAIRSGRIDLLTMPQVRSSSDTTVSRRAPDDVLAVSPGELAAAEAAHKTLDEVIVEWLAEQQRTERVRLRVAGGDDLRFGGPFAFQVTVRTAPGEDAVAGARVSARFLSTERKPVILAEGATDDAGILSLSGTVPPLEKGTGLVVVAVQHASGADEVKYLVRR